jgi:hypothetical protein
MTSDIQVFPDDEGFDSAQFETFQCILDSEAIFTGVLTDFVEVFLNEPFLLNELNV